MRTISTGINAFGAVGLFVGPLILAITVALFTFLREEKRAEPAARSYFLAPKQKL